MKRVQRRRAIFPYAFTSAPHKKILNETREHTTSCRWQLNKFPFFFLARKFTSISSSPGILDNIKTRDIIILYRNVGIIYVQFWQSAPFMPTHVTYTYSACAVWCQINMSKGEKSKDVSKIRER